MIKFDRSNYLDEQHWSPLWEHYLRQAEPFDPLNTNEISVITRIPNQTGVLIFTDTKIYHSEENGLAVLQRFSSAHCFPLYNLVCVCLKALGCFGSYKFPWLCPYFALFPLENTRRTMWINPLKITDLHCEAGLYYAEMTAGPTLLLPILRRSFILRSELACYALALVRHDLFRFANKGDTPLAYLALPDTYFARCLSTRPRLAQFSHRVGAFTHYYNQGYFLYHYENLEEHPKKRDWISW